AVAPVYDIGLLGVPRHTLLKPDRLDAAERSIIQTHCAIGAEALGGVAHSFGAEVPGLDNAAEVARSHHERWDGPGYPDGLVRGCSAPRAGCAVGGRVARAGARGTAPRAVGSCASRAADRSGFPGPIRPKAVGGLHRCRHPLRSDPPGTIKPRLTARRVGLRP